LEELVGANREIGIQVVAYHNGKCVVDASAGRQRQAMDAPAVDGQTLFPIFSVAKGIVVTAAHRQAELGRLDIDAPMASYWPEFAAHGKSQITLRHVLTHRSGLPQMPEGVTVERMADWQWMTRSIAALSPLHTPGAQSFYHAMTFGWLIGEAVRRTDPKQRPFAQFVKDEICAPLGIEDFHFTIDDASRARVATLFGAGYPELPDASTMRVGMPKAVDLTPALFNLPAMQRVVNPAVGAYANAGSIARVFAMLAGFGILDGARLLSAERVRAAIPVRSNPEEKDPFLGAAVPLGVGGYWLGGKKPAVGSRSDILFSIGTGGSLAWADGQYNLAVAITHNLMHYGHTPENDPAAAIGRCIRAGLNIPD
jgi:CubicO group peptidase (beta-lactamase class C family)